MAGIKYDPQQEAYELNYVLWDKDVTVRFYVEEQQEIIDALTDIAQMLDKINRNKKKIAEIILRDGWAGGKKSAEGGAEGLEKSLFIDSCSVELDEDIGIVISLLLGSDDGSLKGLLSVELGEDSGLEFIGWAE
ncbi:MAG: hypothetical protein IJ806_09540 [Ruminococcus sp.]|nr:hypothetical protein [Ruminococcus sp.]